METCVVCLLFVAWLCDCVFCCAVCDAFACVLFDACRLCFFLCVLVCAVRFFCCVLVVRVVCCFLCVVCCVLCAVCCALFEACRRA